MKRIKHYCMSSLQWPLAYKLILAFISGLIFTFSFTNDWFHGLPFFAILTCGVLYFLIINESKTFKVFLYILFFCMAVNLLGFYWLANTLVTFGEIPYWVAVLLSQLFALIVLTPFWPLVLLHKGIASFSFFKKFSLLEQGGLYVTLHVCSEIFMPQLFPVKIGHCWAEWNYSLPLASYFGASIYSWMVLSSAMFLALYFCMDQKKFQKIIYLFAGIPLLLLAIDCLLELNVHYPKHFLPFATKESQTIRIVQANVGNFLKVDAELGSVGSREEVYDRYEALSLAKSSNPFKPEGDNSKADSKIDLIIWPETAIPDEFNSEKEQSNFQNERFNNILARIGKTNLLMGGYDEGYLHQSDNGIYTEYNSALLFNADKKITSVYHKHHLLPFGETLPFGPFNHWIYPYTPGVSLFSQGASFDAIKISEQFQVITPICYEILHPSFIRDHLINYEKTYHDLPQAIINMTNDSWYGKTIEPKQHLFFAKWRVYEFRIPLIRSTNTGISLGIDIDGTETKRLNVDEQNYLDLNFLPQKINPTLFLKYGYFMIYVFMGLFMGIVFLQKYILKKST